MWKRFYFKPFEGFIGLFVIVNGWLTLFPVAEGGSAVKDNLWNLMGYGGIAIPIFQIVAGLLKVVGIAINKANLEAAGLILVTAMFGIRAISLVSDGDVTNSDINNLVIAVGIMASNIIRITQVSNNHGFIITERKI
jgi:hypothetical protein